MAAADDGASGTSLAEILALLMAAPVGELTCYTAVLPSLQAGGRSPLLVFWAEFVCIVLPSILVFCRPAATPYAIGGGAALSAFGILRSNSHYRAARLDRQPPPAFDALASLRATVMVQTCICILAVDFQAFPRRLAKTETFGLGLMDLGAGSMIYVSSLVHAYLRQAPSREEEAAGVEAHHACWRRAVAEAWSQGPILALGSARLASVSAADYHVSATEYGVHWNFFFTTAAVGVLQRALGLTSAAGSSAAGLGLACAHQAALSATSLTHYLLHAPRLGLVSANREGIFGTAGMLALALLGHTCGVLCRASTARMQGPWMGAGEGAGTDAGTAADAWTGAGMGADGCVDAGAVTSPRRLWHLSALAGSYLLLAIACGRTVQPVSRRLSNLAYTLTVAGVCTLGLVVCSLVRTCTRSPLSRGSILQSVSRNQLAAFLFANVITGCVNMTVRTNTVGDGSAVLLLAMYMFAVCAFAHGLDAYGVRLRFKLVARGPSGKAGGKRP